MSLPRRGSKRSVNKGCGYKLSNVAHWESICFFQKDWYEIFIIIFYIYIIKFYFVGTSRDFHGEKYL